ncbi:hypothetical protein [Fretibacterium sp. OH1220_COT-178]|uniref:hypothetical protein n=1 Tax=Fretibacterium sp. OH1220_COT-178 TaxID=2491047 RepID=UPI000F5F4177|nr:hypothetical protein [Fretibacterium sp. OH1220_COT-178]RRD64377.1 hypothetical protein EII26_07700 [Fretibacterium sp. OH1220_COT-178]
MISGRRFLRTAALAAVLALAFAGAAPAKVTRWTGNTSNSWGDDGNWDKGAPGAGDTAIIPDGAFDPLNPADQLRVDTDKAKAKIVEFGEGTKLKIGDKMKLRLDKDGGLRSRGNAVVTIDGELKFGDANTIAVSPDKLLTIVPSVNLDLGAKVTGHLRLEPPAGTTVALMKNTERVTFKGNANNPKIVLAGIPDAFHNELRLEGGNADEVTILPMMSLPNKPCHIGILSCPKLKMCHIDFGGTKKTLIVNSLAPGDGAGIDTDNGGGMLKLGAVAAPGGWSLSLDGGKLELPGGAHKGLALRFRSDSELTVPAATTEPVLTVNRAEPDLGTQLRFNPPDAWHRPLKAGETIDLLQELDLSIPPGNKIIDTDLTNFPGATDEFDLATKTLRLTLGETIDVPLLTLKDEDLKPLGGKKYEVTIGADSKVDPAAWGVLPLNPGTAIAGKVGTDRDCTFTVTFAGDRAKLRVRAKRTGVPFFGVLDFELPLPQEPGPGPRPTPNPNPNPKPNPKPDPKPDPNPNPNPTHPGPTDDDPGKDKSLSGGGGGGCDAVGGVLALALAAAFLARRRA